MDWRTASRSSLRVQTKMGPWKSAGTASPRPRRMSWPAPMLWRARPTLPPPTMAAGRILVEVAMDGDAAEIQSSEVGRRGTEAEEEEE